MAQWVRCLLCMLEDLSSDPHYSHKTIQVCQHKCVTPAWWRQKQADLQGLLTSQLHSAGELQVHERVDLNTNTHTNTLAHTLMHTHIHICTHTSMYTHRPALKRLREKDHCVFEASLDQSENLHKGKKTLNISRLEISLDLIHISNRLEDSGSVNLLFSTATGPLCSSCSLPISPSQTLRAIINSSSSPYGSLQLDTKFCSKASALLTLITSPYTRCCPRSVPSHSMPRFLRGPPSQHPWFWFCFLHSITPISFTSMCAINLDAKGL